MQLRVGPHRWAVMVVSSNSAAWPPCSSARQCFRVSGRPSWSLLGLRPSTQPLSSLRFLLETCFPHYSQAMCPNDANRVNWQRRTQAVLVTVHHQNIHSGSHLPICSVRAPVKNFRNNRMDGLQHRRRFSSLAAAEPKSGSRPSYFLSPENRGKDTAIARRDEVRL